jgi:methionyl aminopeptidase
MRGWRRLNVWRAWPRSLEYASVPGWPKKEGRETTMPQLKSDREIGLMREAGLVLWQAHQVAAGVIKPGVTTAAINDAVEAFFVTNHVTPLFKGVPGKVPFPAATCVSVNDEVVHGIPGRHRLREGDIVSIDIGARLDGWCADAAMTYPVGRINPKRQRLLTVTEDALRLAIELMGQRQRWSEVAREIERFIKDAGFAVVEGLSGHGIGREMWEEPQAPNYFDASMPDFALEPGLVIAVEPMVAMGKKDVWLLQDHWTIATQDGLPSAHFEHTIAITRDGPLVLTAGPDGEGWAMGRNG